MDKWCVVLVVLILIAFTASVLITDHEINDYTNYIIVVGNRAYHVDDYTINGDILEFDDYYYGSTFYDESMVIQGNYSIILDK
jgi:hypothetical protein